LDVVARVVAFIVGILKIFVFTIFVAVKFKDITSLVERDLLSPLALGPTTKARAMHSPGHEGRATW
jgi:hypothetical protein